MMEFDHDVEIVVYHSNMVKNTEAIGTTNISPALTKVTADKARACVKHNVSSDYNVEL